jgi:hypothetical protein
MKCDRKTLCNPCRCGTAEGERRKADAFALLEARRECYVRRGRRALLAVMLDGDGTATADDVRNAVELPGDLDPRCFGSVPGVLARAGLICRAEFAQSGRAERHASYIGVWELVNREAAERWLWNHPDLPDPADVDLGDAVQRVLFPIQEAATPTGDTAGAAL